MGILNESEKTLDPPSGEMPARILNVLVVDDSKLQRKIITANLKNWGFHIFEAEDGRQALDICKTETIDMVISDWIMPEMNGLEFCQEFRKLTRDTYGYFILLTSKSEKDEVALGLEMGADDFLSKPVNSGEFHARIRAGQRVLEMEHALVEKNEAISRALTELQDLYEVIDKDLIEARNLQLSLVPEGTTMRGCSVSTLLNSNGHVGGDLVGYFPFSRTRLGLYSLDVSGHGISSALLTARLAGFLSPNNRSQNVAFVAMPDGEFEPRSPDLIAQTLNEKMIEELETEHYFTLAFADIDLETGKVLMTQAGHPHPAIFSADTEIRYVGKGGPPIGLLPDIPFDTFEFQLAQGDSLILYSDGITECQNPAGELLDEEGFEAILTKHITSSGNELLQDIIWELTAYAENDNLGDDVSAILFKYK